MMNKEQKLKIELLEIQKEKLRVKVENLVKQVNQIDRKIERIKNFPNTKDPESRDRTVQTSSTSNSNFLNETSNFQ